MAAAKKRILIIEDEKALAHALELKLQYEGFTVEIAVNGQQGLDRIASETKYDVVLLDIMMPVLDGFQVLRELLKRPDRPVVIVLSSLSQQEDERRVLALGAKRYFVKSDTPLAVIVEEVKKA